MENLRKFNALKIRIQNSDCNEFNEVLEEILTCQDDLESFVPIVSEKIIAGQYVNDDYLVRLLIKTKDLVLYQKVKPQLWKNPWRLLELYKGRFPDENIETKFCNVLYEIKEKDDSCLRSCIADVIREIGSTKVFPTLDAIDFDLMPSKITGETFYDLLGPIEKLEAMSRIAFLQKIKVAISEIKKREVV